jgi:outer membrane protein assembly factor BamB
MGWDGLSVTVTKPDGTTETISNIRTDATGGTGVVYVPTVAGNYTLQTHFPQQVTTASKQAAGTPVNTTMLASDSAKLTLVVTEEPIRIYPATPLPTEYWTRPINAQFREWYSIAGSSWEDNEYNAAPETPHILWTKPLTMGGLVGGQLGLVGSGGTSVAMENGDAYQGKWSSRIIIAGILIYTHDTNIRPLVYTAVDLHTGEELWKKTFLDNRTITMGQLFYWQSYNYQGTFAYLWVTVGTTWSAFDPFTGEPRYSMTNVPSGTNIIGEKGEIYRYTVNQAQGWMALWNSSALGSMSGSWNPSGGFGGNIYGVLNASATVNASTTVLSAAAQRAWAWNITIPKGLPGSVRAVKLGDRVVGSNLNATDVNIWAFSLKKGSEGALLFNYDWKAPADWLAGNQTISWVTTDLTTNIGLVWSKETFQHYGFSLETGNYLWITEPQYYLSTYTSGRRIYDGKLYSVGMSGIVYCYDLTTGKTLWTYDVRDPYSANILWSDNWPETLLFASGGKLYFFHSEHSANQPLPRGAPALCLNATNGEVIWRVDGLFRKTDWGGSPIMGESVIAMYNTYDQCVYAIGKGASATTVTAPDIGVQLGKSVLIKGTVTDVSPGTEQTAVKLRFPDGVPAVSDESVGEWMKYVYQQFPRPANASGVEVVVSVLDSNNNYYEVGRATSDASGFFKLAFTPEVPGEYTIYASFAGSGAYYGSFAETAINVEEAPAATPPPTPTPAPMTDTYVLGIGSAILIAVIIGFVVLILIFRKR